MTQEELRSLIKIALRIKDGRVGSPNTFREWTLSEKILSEGVFKLLEELKDRELGVALMRDGGTDFLCTGCNNWSYEGHSKDCIYPVFDEFEELKEWLN